MSACAVAPRGSQHATDGETASLVGIAAAAPIVDGAGRALQLRSEPVAVAVERDLYGFDFGEIPHQIRPGHIAIPRSSAARSSESRYFALSGVFRTSTRPLALVEERDPQHGDDFPTR